MSITVKSLYYEKKNAQRVQKRLSTLKIVRKIVKSFTLDKKKL